MALTEARARERWSEGTPDDDPFVKLGARLLVTAARAEVTCVRVRSDGEPAVQGYGGGWAPLGALSSPPQKILEPLIWRLKFMADVAAETTLQIGASLRLMTGPGAAGMHDFDVCFSRTNAGSAIVLLRLPTRFGFYSNVELTRRAWISLALADDATERDEVLARVREAVALVPESDGARAAILQTAAATCGRAGLFEESLSFLGLALPIAEDTRTRGHVEHTMGLAYADTRRLDEAVTWQERAIATAETLPAPHVHAIAPLVSLADVSTDRGDLDGAELHLARAEALASDTFGVTSAAFVRTRLARARLVRARGDGALAESLATEALSAAERFDLDSTDLRAELADLALARGDAAAAASHLRTILRVPSRHPDRARTYTLLARALRSTGNDAEALSALRAASVLASDVLASDHPIRLEIERELALLSATSPYR